MKITSKDKTLTHTHKRSTRSNEHAHGGMQAQLKSFSIIGGDESRSPKVVKVL